METTVIMIIVNVVVSILSTIDCIRSIKKSPTLMGIIEMWGKKHIIWSIGQTIIMLIAIYVAILFGEGIWNTIGWWAYWIDMISMVITVLLYRLFCSNMMKI